ncbi:MAG TPA: hypothetical protein DDW52_12505 [Planctomycetaceae bacterium]|nr:hypothetical protein [Planctomycetaceae bacterium]
MCSTLLSQLGCHNFIGGRICLKRDSGLLAKVRPARFGGLLHSIDPAARSFCEPEHWIEQQSR